MRSVIIAADTAIPPTTSPMINPILFDCERTLPENEYGLASGL